MYIYIFFFPDFFITSQMECSEVIPLFGQMSLFVAII